MAICSSSYKETRHLGLGPVLPQYDLILTLYICNIPISKKKRKRSHSKVLGLGLEHVFLEDALEPITPTVVSEGPTLLGGMALGVSGKRRFEKLWDQPVIER